MSWWIARTTLVFACAFALVALVRAEPARIGATEPVWLAGRLRLEARVDTGARLSSLDAERIETFRRGGKTWVRFEVVGDDGYAHRYERVRVRTARVRRHQGRVETRPVVRMEICLDRVAIRAQVNLVDRRGLRYRMLIGRNFLGDRFLVDAGANDLTEPKCAGQPFAATH